MTFTWDNTLATDLALVRFWVGDTNSNGYYLDDEVITALLASNGSVGGAVVACVQYIITQLNRPDFRADWLQVTNKAAADGWRAHLLEMRRHFGVAAITATAVHTYRHDSLQDSSADYNADGSADN